MLTKMMRKSTVLYLEASEFQSFKNSRCGLGGVRGKQSGFPSGVTGSASDRQRGVSPYESNPPKADYLEDEWVSNETEYFP